MTFRRTAAELGLRYESLDFEAAFSIDIRGRQGDRSVRQVAVCPPVDARLARGAG